MKSKDLINILEKFPEAEVRLHYTTWYTNDDGTSFDEDNHSDVQGIGLQDDGKIILSTDWSPKGEDINYREVHKVEKIT
jgi:hypothetical protein